MNVEHRIPKLGPGVTAFITTLNPVLTFLTVKGGFGKTWVFTKGLTPVGLYKSLQHGMDVSLSWSSSEPFAVAIHLQLSLGHPLFQN